MRFTKFFTLLALLLMPLTGAAQISLVKVKVTTNPGAQIGIDDEMSDTNTFSKELVSGEHEVTIRYNGDVVKRESIDVPVGEFYNEDFDISGKLNVNSTPEAIVILDGEEIGNTPQSVGLLGPHSLKVKYKNKAYSATKPETFNVSPFDNIERNYTLKRNKHAHEWRWHILVEGVLPTTDFGDVQPGFMVAFAKVIGFYVKGTCGLYWKNIGDSDRVIWSESKEHKSNYFHGIGGLMYNIIRPLYIYAGAGYGEFHVWRKSVFGDFVKTEYTKGPVIDLGLMYTYKHLSLTAGASYMVCEDMGNTDKIISANIGIGVSF